MIKIDRCGSKFCATLDINHEYYPRVCLIVRALLSSAGVGKDQPDTYSFSFADFLNLKNKLDSMGLVKGRKMSKEALALLNEYRASLKRNDDIKNGIHNELIEKSLEGKLKTTPYPDQITGISYLVNNRRAGLFDEMGCGKTSQALGVVVSSSSIRKSLVICPKNVLLGFSREVEKHTYLKSITVPPGRAKSLKFIQENKDCDWDFMLIHPENLVSSDKKSVYGDNTKLLRTMRFDAIFVDEWHMYKNLEAKRTQCVLDLLSSVRDHRGNPCRVVVMTGTPVSESPMNAYVTLKVLGDERMPNITKFENYFTIKQKRKIKKKFKTKRGKFVVREIEVPKIVGYQNLGELKDRLEAVSIRRTKESMKGFPDKTITIRDVELSGTQAKLYRTACKEVVASLSKTSRVNLEKFFSGNTQAVRLRQLLNHPKFLDETCDSAKYEEIDRILEEILSDPEQKVIIWSEYRKAIDFIYDRWNAQYGVVKVRGGVEIDDALANSFEYDPDIRIAAAIPAKAGTGTDFLARARTAIYIDRPYSYTQYKQSLDRIHRRVKTEGELSWLDKMRSQPATLIFLDVPDSIDELVRLKLQSKDEVANALTISDTKLIQIGKAELLRYLR